ncbi:hypothetical protein [Nocardioides mangrovicus]|uniref:hypothetical protein n=1 Tax=Nocardioides mangrovicus TaxID=2478913 RepID=UPI0011C45CFE|nr:hypothetical protein [Nocardioides mangrovicus]
MIEDGVHPRDLVGLSRRLIDVDRELRALEMTVDATASASADDDAAFDPRTISKRSRSRATLRLSPPLEQG